MPLTGVLISLSGCKLGKNEGQEAILKERRQWMKEYALCTC